MIKLDDEDDDLLLPEPDFQDMHEDVALFCVCKVPLTGDMLPCAGGACEGNGFITTVWVFQTTIYHKGYGIATNADQSVGLLQSA